MKLILNKHGAHFRDSHCQGNACYHDFNFKRNKLSDFKLLTNLLGKIYYSIIKTVSFEMSKHENSLYILQVDFTLCLQLQSIFFMFYKTHSTAYFFL